MYLTEVKQSRSNKHRQTPKDRFNLGRLRILLRPKLRPIQRLSPPRLVQCQTTDDINDVMGIILWDKGVQKFFLEQGVRISPFMTQLSQKICSTEYKLCTFSVLPHGTDRHGDSRAQEVSRIFCPASPPLLRAKLRRSVTEVNG